MEKSTFNDFTQFYNNRNSDNWNFAKHYIPKQFESKYIIHWSVGIIDDFPFERYPLNNLGFKSMNERVRIEQEFNVLLKEEKWYNPIPIIDLANRFNVPYSHKTVDHIPETPGITLLEDLTLLKLKESLKKLSENSELNLLIYDSEEYQYPSDLKKEYINITIEKYFELQEMYSFQLETCLFTENFNWCLVTGEEAPILFGCKKEIESEILKEISLELFKVKDDDEMY